jgi:predicted transposase/invertase (TIGR01784 family)
MSKYLNPFTDFGFKKIFGEESSKDILKDFLNELLREEEGEIVELEFMKTERLGATEYDRKAVFDLYCKNQDGEKFIVELQKTKHNYFKDRSVYYATFPIQEQALKGEWNYELKAVYTIGILGFEFEEDKKDKDKFLYKIKLSDIETKKVFYDKLTFIYLEMPKFKKELEDCHTHFDKWMYVIQNLGRLERYPKALQEKIFEKIFKKAELAKLSEPERASYHESLKNYRDWYAIVDTAKTDAWKEGKVIGRAEGEQIGIAKGEQIGIAKGMIRYTTKTDSEIAKETGLDVETVKNLRISLK